MRNNYQDSTAMNGHLSFFMPLNAVLELGVKYSDVTYGFPVVNDPSRSDYDPGSPDFYANADQLRHLNWPQYAKDDPHWVKHTTYLDGIFHMPVGPGTINIHGYVQSELRIPSERHLHREPVAHHPRSSLLPRENEHLLFPVWAGMARDGQRRDGRRVLSQFTGRLSGDR